MSHSSSETKQSELSNLAHSLDWDPEIDTPARILIIGGGTTGIEAALYARFLGFEVSIVERRRVGQQLAAWEDQPMPADWNAITSALGIAALEAQGTLQIDDFHAVPSSRQFVEQYLIPVAKTDLLYNSVQIRSEVCSISRLGLFSKLPVTNEQKADVEFRVLINSHARGQYTEIFDAIVDCSGHSQRLGLASGGGEAAGESWLSQTEQPHSLTPASQPKELDDQADVSLHPRVISGLLNTKTYSAAPGSKIVNFGGGWEACVNALKLSEQCSIEQSQIIWLIPKTKGLKAAQPDLPWQANFELGLQPETDTDPPSSDSWKRYILDAVKRMRQLTEASTKGFTTLEVWGVESIQPIAKSRFELVVQSRLDETLALECDQLVVSAARCADWSFTKSLNLAHSKSMLTSEPHYYVLGDKSQPPFAGKALNPLARLLRTREQIQQAFALIGGRHDLNLYETVKPQRS